MAPEMWDLLGCICLQGTGNPIQLPETIKESHFLTKSPEKSFSQKVTQAQDFKLFSSSISQCSSTEESGKNVLGHVFARKGKWKLLFKATASNPAIKFDKECAILFHDSTNYGYWLPRHLLFCWAWGKTLREVFLVTAPFRALGAARASFQEQSDELGELTLS